MIIAGSGVDTSSLKPVIKNKNTRNILLPARLLYEKGIEEFVKASKILKQKNVKGIFIYVEIQIVLILLRLN